MVAKIVTRRIPAGPNQQQPVMRVVTQASRTAMTILHRCVTMLQHFPYERCKKKAIKASHPERPYTACTQLPKQFSNMPSGMIFGRHPKGRNPNPCTTASGCLKISRVLTQGRTLTLRPRGFLCVKLCPTSCNMHKAIWARFGNSRRTATISPQFFLLSA